ncbi:MAG: hypothetical protein KF816_02370 [Melioribacteraceae bacterium]|jgi:hypothetical protein|nr:hypothetical protein [Melioribacteraceae bacterium]
MKLNYDELRHRIRNDHRFKKRLRRIVLLGGLTLILISLTGIFAIIFFSSAIISFLFAHVPGLLELGFNYLRGFAASYMQEDLTSLINSIGVGANVNEMKNLVNQYFNQLASNTAIDFKSFSNFITTVKNSLIDNSITANELDLVRKFLLN